MFNYYPNTNIDMVIEEYKAQAILNLGFEDKATEAIYSIAEMYVAGAMRAEVAVYAVAIIYEKAMASIVDDEMEDDE